MKVIENSKKNTIDFAKLDPGDCFRWCDELYVRSELEQEATGLKSGYPLEDMGGEQVTFVNAEVRIIN